MKVARRGCALLSRLRGGHHREHGTCCSRVPGQNEAAGHSSGGFDRWENLVCKRDVSTTRLAIVHLEVAQIDVGISLALIRRLVEDLGPTL